MMTGLISILVLTLMGLRGGMATSEFLGELALCFVDKELSFNDNNLTFREESFRNNPPYDLRFSSEPVLDRGTAARFDNGRGSLDINNDGLYLLTIHRPGVVSSSYSNFSMVLPLLVEIKRDGELPYTIATIPDLGDGTIFTMNLLAELKRGDGLFINTQGSEVSGYLMNPFVYSAFIIYHDPIVTFPPVRQAAFSVSGFANLSEPYVIDDLDVTTVNIGDGYDNSTGVFTAPFGGVYIFHLSVIFVPVGPPIMGPGWRGAVALQVDGSTVGQATARVPYSMLFGGGLSGRNAAITVAQSLEQNAEVSLWNVIGSEEVGGMVDFVGYLLA